MVIDIDQFFCTQNIRIGMPAAFRNRIHHDHDIIRKRLCIIRDNLVNALYEIIFRSRLFQDHIDSALRLQFF